MTDIETKERLAKLETHAEYTQTSLTRLHSKSDIILESMGNMKTDQAVHRTQTKRQAITVSAIIAAAVGVLTKLIQ
jgi:hypothetical protein